MDAEYVMLFNEVNSASPTARFEVATLIGNLHYEFMRNAHLPMNLPVEPYTARLYYLRNRYQFLFQNLMAILHPINDPSQIPSPVVSVLNFEMIEMFAVGQEFDYLKQYYQRNFLG